MQQLFGIPVPPGIDPVARCWPSIPTQLYETAIMLGAFACSGGLRASEPGRSGGCSALYLVFAGIERFLVEILRAKDDRLSGPVHPRAADQRHPGRDRRGAAIDLVAKGPEPAPGTYLEAGKKTP